MRCPLCSAQLHEDDVDLCEACSEGWWASTENARQIVAWEANGGLDQRDERWERIYATSVADYVRRMQFERANGGRT